MSARYGLYDIGKSVGSRVKQIIWNAPLAPLKFALTPHRAPPEFAALPEFLRLGDRGAAIQMLDGDMHFFGATQPVKSANMFWQAAAPSRAFAAHAHGFSWLDDLACLASAPRQPAALKSGAQALAAELVDGWAANFNKWNNFAWSADLVAARLFYLLSNWRAIFPSGSSEKDAPRRALVLRHAKVLRQQYGASSPGIDRLRAAAAFVISGACFAGRQPKFLDHGLDLLDDELSMQILPDGGHISRSPRAVMDALDIALRTDRALAARGLEGSREIGRAIDRLTPMLDFFTAHDGGLYSFNGGHSCSRDRRAALRKAVDMRPAGFGYGPHVKYQRIERADLTVMIDVGGAPPPKFDNCAHLAPLALAVSTTAGRLIVNCGSGTGLGANWQQALRRTAAHSTLELDGVDTGRLSGRSWRGAIFPNAIASDRSNPVAKRQEQDSGTWLTASHTGYQKKYGLTHRRRIYVDILGNDIRGEDTVLVAMGRTPVSRKQIAFSIRFHLHPDVRVTMARDGKSALLIQPGNHGWRFRTDGQSLKIEKSVFSAGDGPARRSEQLVIAGQAFADSDGEAAPNLVRWTLKKLGKLDLRGG